MRQENRTFTIEMTEQIVTTLQVDQAWLEEHKLPLNIETLSGGDFDEQLFEGLDALVMNQEESTQGVLSFDYAVTERDFLVTRDDEQAQP